MVDVAWCVSGKPDRVDWLKKQGLAGDGIARPWRRPEATVRAAVIWQS